MADIVTDLGVNYNWKAYKNGHNSFTIALTNGGVAFNTSSYVFTLNIKNMSGGSTKLALTEGSGITNGGATGVLTIELTQTQASTTLPRNDYFWELTYVVNDLTYRMLQGNLTLSSESNPASTSASVSVSVNLAGTALTAAITIPPSITSTSVIDALGFTPGKAIAVYASPTALRAVDTSSAGVYPTGTFALIQDTGTTGRDIYQLYMLDRSATDTDDTYTSIAPTTGSGRWITTDFAEFIRRYLSNLVLVPSSSAGVVEITSIVSTTVNFTIPSLHLQSFGAAVKTISASGATSLTNATCLYVDLTNLLTASAVTYGTLSTTTVKNSIYRLPIIYNRAGRLFSTIPSFQKVLDDAHVAYDLTLEEITYNDVYLDAGGEGEEDTDLITTQLAAIADNTATNQYRIFLKPGIYRENGSGSDGLVLKDYVHIYGTSPYNTEIRNVAAVSSGEEVNQDVIHRAANCELTNVKLVAYKCKYALHVDSTSNDGFRAKNIICHHRGGASGSFSYDIGIGVWEGQSLSFENVECLGAGVYIHGTYSGRVQNSPWTVDFNSIKANELYVDDFSEYQQNYLNLTGSQIQILKYRISDTYYLANSADPLYNQGYLRQSINLNTDGSKIESFEYVDADTLTWMGGIIPIRGLSVIGVNKNAGTISAGYAVKLLAAPGVPDADNEGTADENIDIYNASGILYGVAMEDIATSTQGTIQISGRPTAYCMGASSAITYGDALEINSSGQFEKRSTGETIGYALEATSADELIRIKLK